MGREDPIEFYKIVLIVVCFIFVGVFYFVGVMGR
jgi:hypothetical protein